MESRSQPRLQFDLWTLFALSLICAVCVYNRQTLLELSFGYFYPLAFSVFIAGWWTIQRIRTESADIDVPRKRFSTARVGLPIALLACGFSLWLRHRWVAMFYDGAWPRPFPYPDEILFAYHSWLDSQYPAEPGFFKIHGEVYTVWRHLNMIAMTLSASVGAILGLLCSKNGPFGTTFWYKRVLNIVGKRHR